MRDHRTEGRDLQTTMETLSLGRRVTPATADDAAGCSVRCPSCDHANPSNSHFCNQCGMPVHFEACGRCDAINLRGATSCHKCGRLFPGSAIPESAIAAPAAVETLSTLAERPPTASSEPPPEVAAAAQRRRHGGMPAALIASALVLVAVPTYIATEHPASFHRVIEAMAPRGNVAADSPAPTSGPLQPSSVGQPPEPVNAQPVPPAATSDPAASAPQAAGAPPSEIARDVKGQTAAATAAVAPAVAKSSRPATTKSNASRSKQGTNSRKPPTRKPVTKAP